jgi:hypothetical protein
MSRLLTTVSDDKHAFSDSSYPSGRVRSSNTQHLNRRVRVSPGPATARGSYLCMNLRLRVEFYLGNGQREVLSHARLICGVCLANPGNVPRSSLSVMPYLPVRALCHRKREISGCKSTDGARLVASFSSEVEERKVLVQILRDAEREEGWPTT